MKRSFALFTVAAVLLSGPFASKAFAQEETTTSGEQSVVRKPGALFDTSIKERPQMLSFFVSVPYYFGFGIGLGARYTIPIVKEGFIPKLNDSVELEFGLDFNISPANYVSFGVPVEGRWTFQITPEFAAYGKVGIGFGGHFWTGAFLGSQSFFWPYPSGGVGILYKLGSVYLRAETGTPSLLKVGIGIPF